MVRELRARGFSAGKGRVERLMREHGIHARHKRRYPVTTDAKHGLPVAENRLARNFMPTAPNQVWTSDISSLWTDEGGLYLAIVRDLFNREVVGWSLKPRMTSDIVTDALTMAWFRKRPAARLMHYSERGSQYARHAFQSTLKAYGMACSMSRKGNCWNSAPTESRFNRFKNERVHALRYATHADIKAAAFEYIEVFYNRNRQHSTLGYQSPVQFLENWIKAQHQKSRSHEPRPLANEKPREPHSPQQVAEVEDFVEFLATKTRKQRALDRLLAIAPALEAAGVAPMSEDDIAAEVDAVRAERRIRKAGSTSKDSGADRS